MEGFSYQRNKNFFFFFFSFFPKREKGNTPTNRKMRLVTSKKENKGQRAGILSDELTNGLQIQIQEKKLNQCYWNQLDKRKTREGEVRPAQPN